MTGTITAASLSASISEGEAIVVPWICIDTEPTDEAIVWINPEDEEYIMYIKVDDEWTGIPGFDGVGIESIEKTSTTDLVDTYTITLSDGRTTTFDVTNGADGEPDWEDYYEINNVIGSKNVFMYPFHESTLTRNGLTFTDNEDGTITVTGTATASTDFELISYDDNFKPTSGIYRATGIPERQYLYYIDYYVMQNGISINYGKDIGQEIAFPIRGTLKAILHVESGTTMNATISPMLRPSGYSDNTFCEFGATNQMLTKKIQKIKEITAESTDFADFQSKIAEL